MEEDILDSIQPENNIRNAQISFWTFGITVLYMIVTKFVDIPQSTPIPIVVFAFIFLMIIPFIGVFYAYQSFAKHEDSIWFRMIGTIGNGILALVYTWMFIDGTFINTLKSLLEIN